jgi:signal transduction histidine kinase
LDAPLQVGLLVHKIAHDVSGPMGAVTGLLELMKDTPALPADAADDLGIALQELKRVSRLVNRMTEYVKPGRVEKEPLELPALLDTVLSVISFLPNAKDIKISRDPAPSKSLMVFANKNELQQVFFNMLKNAAEAIAPASTEKTIRVSFSRQEEFAAVTVADSGPGFPETMLRDLGKEVQSTKAQGSGIGLIIVREILEAYGGSLSCRNRPEGGAAVTASFPIYESTTLNREAYEPIHN